MLRGSRGVSWDRAPGGRPYLPLRRHEVDLTIQILGLARTPEGTVQRGDPRTAPWIAATNPSLGCPAGRSCTAPRGGLESAHSYPRSARGHAAAAYDLATCGVVSLCFFPSFQ